MSTITKDTVQSDFSTGTNNNIVSSIAQYVIPMNTPSQFIPINQNSLVCKLTLVDVQPMAADSFLVGQLVQGSNHNPIPLTYNGMGYGIDSGGNDGFGTTNQQNINFWPNNRNSVAAETGIFGTIEIYNNYGDISLIATLGAPYAWANQPFMSIQSIGLSTNQTVPNMSGIILMFTSGLIRQGTIVVETLQRS